MSSIKMMTKNEEQKNKQVMLRGSEKENNYERKATFTFNKI
jgi:hypothetical protein